MAKDNGCADMQMCGYANFYAHFAIYKRMLTTNHQHICTSAHLHIISRPA